MEHQPANQKSVLKIFVMWHELINQLIEAMLEILTLVQKDDGSMLINYLFRHLYNMAGILRHFQMHFLNE